MFYRFDVLNFKMSSLHYRAHIKRFNFFNVAKNASVSNVNTGISDRDLQKSLLVSL